VVVAVAACSGVGVRQPLVNNDGELGRRELYSVCEVKAEYRHLVIVAVGFISAALLSRLGTGIELGSARDHEALLLHHSVDGYGCFCKGL
jgi:hypothetical protein